MRLNQTSLFVVAFDQVADQDSPFHPLNLANCLCPLSLSKPMIVDDQDLETELHFEHDG